MEMKNLKIGLFGFQKDSVFQYISAIEEEFSTKLMEKDAQTQKNEEQSLLRIRQLEEELKDVREQLEKQKDAQMMIANTLLDAQRYAEYLKKETEEKEREAQRQLDDLAGKKQRELDEYQMQIQHIREILHSLLIKIDGEAQEMEQCVTTIKEKFPDHNMLLFSRKTESVE